MQGRTNDVAMLTDRINAEPAIVRGLSSSEAVIAAAGSFMVWLPLSLLIGWMVGHMQVALIFISVGTMGTVFLLSGWLHKVKRDRPEFYFQQMLKKRRAEVLGFIFKTRYVNYSGIWMLGRTLDAEQRSWKGMHKFFAVFGVKQGKN